MKTYKRRGNKWTINETLQLQREYELLEWNVSEISEKHQRSVESILYKLEIEGFIDSWKNARGYCYNEYTTSHQKDVINFLLNHHHENVSENVSEEEKTNHDKLDDRVCNLESTVKDIASMVEQILTSITEKNVKNNNSKNKLYL
jgi:hypothetical protein